MRDSWEVKSVLDLCNVKGGKRLPAGEEFDLGKTPFPYLRVTNMVNGSIDDSDLKYVKVEIEPLIRNYKISKKDLYVTIAGTLGKFGSIPSHLDNAQLTENAAKLCDINFEIIDKKYFKYYLNSRLMDKQIFREIGVGGGVPKLAIHRIQSLKVNLPKLLSEQKKIAQILSTCDTVLEQTEAAIAKYQAIKQGMLHDLFTRGIDLSTGQLREPYKDAPDLYKETELGFVPKEWEVRVVKNLLKSNKLITYGIVQPGDYISDGVYMIRSQDYTKGWNGIETIMQVHSNIDKPYERSRVYTGDILITVVGANVGRMAIVPDFLNKANISRSVARISIDSEIIDSKYCYYYLKSQITQILYANQVGGAQPVINLKSLELFELASPKEKREQIEISKRVQSINDKIYAEQQTLAKYTQLKAGLMQDLLSGVVGVEGLID